MPIHVEVPGHGIVEFPDGTSEDVMRQALMTLGPSAAEPKSVGGFLSNVVSSGGKFVGDMASSVKDSAYMLGRGVQGMFDPMTAVENGQAVANAVQHAPETGKALLGAAKGRYGSLGAVGNTLYNDPVGAASDVATLAGGVGALAKLGGAGRVARVAGAVESATNPMSLAAKGVEKVAAGAGPALERSGVSLYSRVLKPDRGQLEKLGPKWGATLPEKAANVSEQLIKEGVNVTPTGVAKIGDSINDLGAQRSAIIEGLDNYDPVANPNGNVTRVPTAPMTAAIDDAAKFAGRQLDPSAAVASVESGHGRLQQNPGLSKIKRQTVGGLNPRVAQAGTGVSTVPAGRELLPQVRVSKLEDMAKGTRAEMRAQGNAYAGGRLPADVSRDKAMLAGANQAIGSADPAIKPLSDEMARKITLEDILERGSLRTGKHELLSGFDLIAAQGNPGWLAARLAQRGGVGSQAARGLHKLGGAVGKMEISPLAQQLALLLALEGRDQ